jgi:NADH-quinone oxidoreductase subunit A
MFITDILITIVLFSLSVLLAVLGYFVGTILANPMQVSYERISSYECGFEAFSDAREPFEIKFYLIALLFIIFDVEVIFFFPWAFSIRDVYWEGFFVILFFTVILLVGYLYEARKGCLTFA